MLTTLFNPVGGQLPGCSGSHSWSVREDIAIFVPTNAALGLVSNTQLWRRFYRLSENILVSQNVSDYIEFTVASWSTASNIQKYRLRKSAPCVLPLLTSARPSQARTVALQWELGIVH